MPYGIIKVDTVTFTDNGVDKDISLSGLVQNPTFTGNVTATGTISGDIIRGGTTISGATVTGTTANFTSGVFTTQLSGVTITGTTVATTTGTFTSLTGTTTTGTTANFVSGVFSTQVSGVTITGTTVAATTGTFTSLTGTTATFTSGIIASGTAALPSLAILSDPNTGIYSPGADQLAVATNGTQRLTVDTAATTSTLPVVHPLGAVGTPSITFTGDLNTGFWSPSADALAASTAGAERLRITSAGLVGIGTSSPTSKLDVRGSATDFDGLRVLNTENSSGNQTSSAIRLGITNSFGAVDGIRNCRIQATEHNADSNEVHLDFYTNSAVALDQETVKMRLTSGGALGIGTTSPIATIDITGTGECMRIQSTTAASNYITHKHNSSGDIAYIGAAGGGALTSGANTDYAIRANQGALLFGTNGNNERARIDSSGRLLVGTVTQVGNVNGGILQLGSGITFPATAVAASDANTLDDYEEGTWTPTHVSGLASGGFSGAAGRYTKIGQIVTVRMQTNFTAGGGTASLSAKLIIGGLPFSAPINAGPTVGGENNFGGELPWNVSSTRTNGSEMIINATAYPTSAVMNRLEVNSTYSLV